MLRNSFLGNGFLFSTAPSRLPSPSSRRRRQADSAAAVPVEQERDRLADLDLDGSTPLRSGSGGGPAARQRVCQNRTLRQMCARFAHKFRTFVKSSCLYIFVSRYQ